jgi:hypothetical protein
MLLSKSMEMEIPESLFPILFGVFIVIVFCLIIVLSLWRYRIIGRLMKQQAQKRGGTISGSFLLPLLKFSYRALPILVTSVPGTRYRVAKTEAAVTFLRPVQADLGVVRESVGTRLGKKLGATDVILGSDEFDREFLIKTKDELFARNVLSFTLQSKLLGMMREKPRITMEGTWLTVAVPRVIKTEEGYDQLLDLTFAVVDRLLEL